MNICWSYEGVKMTICPRVLSLFSYHWDIRLRLGNLVLGSPQD